MSRNRVSARAPEAGALSDARFVRLWRYCLAAAQQTLLQSPQVVFQFRLCRRPDAVPIIRDYLCLATAPVLAQAAE